MTWIMAGLIAGLIVIYLTQPNYRRFIISSAQFFMPSPSAPQTTIRFRLDNLIRSLPFYVQLAALILLLLALHWLDQRRESEKLDSVGVWVIVDTSASMSTIQDGMQRIEIARREASSVIDQVNTLANDVRVCMDLTTFDLSQKEIAAGLSPTQTAALLPAIDYRPMGTDLNELRGLADQAEKKKDDCMITHLVIMSDRPAPDWIEEAKGNLTVIWRDIGQPVPNVGITSASRLGGAVLGWNGQIVVKVAAYGGFRDSVTARVTNPGGIPISETILTWDQSDTQKIAFTASAPGNYTVSLDPGGAYAYDDQLILTVGEIEQIRVDWQLADRTWPGLLGWQISAENPNLRVIPFENATDSPIPTLLVGNAYGMNSIPAEIGYFLETSPLLEDLNFDVAERLNIQGIKIKPGSPMLPVLQDTHDQVWLAASRDPLVAYVPGLPTATGDPALDGFSTTAFFNGLRWLLQERTLPELYTLTSVGEPDPSGNRVVLHPDEGNTGLAAHSVGELKDVSPIRARSRGNPIWPELLTAAAVVFCFERCLSVFGGARWRH